MNASTLDETITDVQPGQTFGGLHAIERDLWVSGDALSDASGLEPQAQVAEFVLSRLTLPPDAIGTIGVDELNWVDDVAIPGREELYSHLDAVDISATIAAADQAFDAVEPLAHQVAPSLSAVVAARFAALESEVAGLGPVTWLARQRHLVGDSLVPLPTGGRHRRRAGPALGHAGPLPGHWSAWS